MINDVYLNALDKLLFDYFFDVSMALHEPVDGLTDDQNEFRSMVQMEAVHVRGEGFAHQLGRAVARRGDEAPALVL